MRRRDFIKGIAGAATIWPAAARAQQPAMPVIGFLGSASAELWAGRLRAFRQGLKDTGYIEGENVAIEYRWAENQMDRLPALADELVRRKVAVIMAAPGAEFPAKAATTTVPIVFIADEDPVRLGLVASLARPGGNLTGINQFDEKLAVKRLELLRELIPGVNRVAVPLGDPKGLGQFFFIFALAQPGIEVVPVMMKAREATEIEHAIETFARSSNSGLLVTSGALTEVHRELITTLAARHRLPAVYPNRSFVSSGGLISYGPDQDDEYRRAAGYVARILKGEKPAELPVQAPTKYELVINQKTAKALGLEVPPTLLATADEVID